MDSKDCFWDILPVGILDEEIEIISREITKKRNLSPVIEEVEELSVSEGSEDDSSGEFWACPVEVISEEILDKGKLWCFFFAKLGYF